MSLRNILFPAGLAAAMSGCVINPAPYGYYEQRYDDDYYYDYRSSPSYQGYYYARIIFIGSVPYYVDDDRYIRPIPPRLYDHFRRYRYDSSPPAFSRDTEVRDGYPVSRIVYLDGTPYHVGDDRNARPLPERLQPHFGYPQPGQGDNPAYRNRLQPPGQPSYGPLPGRPYGRRDDGRNDRPPANVRDPYRERFGQPPIESGPSEGAGNPHGAPGARTAPASEPRNLPPPQALPNAGPSHPGAANSPGPDPGGNRLQAPAGIKPGGANAGRQGSRNGMNGGQGQSDHGSNRENNGNDQRYDKGEHRNDNDRGNGNRRD